MKCYILPTYLISLYTNLVLFFVTSKMFFTKSAATFGRYYAAHSDLPTLLCHDPLSIYPLSFAMIHSMLLSKLPSITRFSSQPFTSHWCTEKITFLYFWQCFHNKWLISQHDSSLLLTVWHTLAKAMYLRVHFRMKALWYKEHTSHLQSHPDVQG